MKGMKRFSAFLLAAFLILSPLAGCTQQQNPETTEGKLIILHTNDIHGRAVEDPDNDALGYAIISQMKKDFIEDGASVLLLDAGDASQGTSLVNLSQGKTAFEFMNLAGYDAMCPGNHEFDWGSDNLLQNRDVAEFPILSANIVDQISGEPIFEANKVFEVSNGTKVGIFGLTTPETLTKTHPDKVKNVNFLMAEELFKAAQDQIDELKAQGCDIIICLGHLGVADESTGNRSIDVIKNTNGINLFIDGHSHTTYKNGLMVDDTLLVSTGEYSRAIGVVSFNGSNASASLHTVARDTEVADAIEIVNAEVNAQLAEVFARTTVLLNGEREPGVRTQETNLGDFCTDALLWQAKQYVGEDVDAALTNGGGIRTSIPAGDISMSKMKEVFPFGNTVAVIEVTGEELLEALEAATHSTPTSIGAFPQVSGIVFKVDTTVAYVNGEQYPESTYYKPANPGARVTIESVGGKPFDAAAVYTIATNDFTAAGGDTYYVFKYPGKTAAYDTGISMEDALVNYTKEVLGGVIGDTYARPQNRITIIK